MGDVAHDEGIRRGSSVESLAGLRTVFKPGKGLATEVAPRGVRVTTVSPGPTRTSVWESPDGLGARLAEAAGAPQEAFVAQLPAAMGVPTGRMIEPDEVAALITFLASPISRSVTGSDHRVDGGLVHAS